MTQYEYLLITRDKYDRAINNALAKRNISERALDSLFAHRDDIAQRIDIIERDIIDTAKHSDSEYNTKRRVIASFR